MQESVPCCAQICALDHDGDSHHWVRHPGGQPFIVIVIARLILCMQTYLMCPYSCTPWHSAQPMTCISLFPGSALSLRCKFPLVGSIFLPTMQVVGSAIAISLLSYGAVPLWAGVIVTAVASFVLLLLERLGVRYLEALFAVLIGLMAVAFGVMYVLAGVPTAEVLEGEACCPISA